MKDNDHRKPRADGPEYVKLMDLFPQIPAEPVQAQPEPEWLRIQQQGSNLVVFVEGREVGTYPRTAPADPSNDQAWAQELITDVGQLARMALSRVVRQEPGKARFKR